MKNIEIERKWLMDAFPDIPCKSEEVTEQGYLSFEPTVRIRRYFLGDGNSDICCLTIKGKGTLQRIEVEVPLNMSQYTMLETLLVTPKARKRLRRYTLDNGLELECSLVDEGVPTSFYYAEVEFENTQQAQAFVPPAFLGREVTEEPGYTMAAYSKCKLAMQEPEKQLE